jgi:hypothetical protein
LAVVESLRRSGGSTQIAQVDFSLTKLIGLAARVSLANECIECRNTKTFFGSACDCVGPSCLRPFRSNEQMNKNPA